MLLELISSVFTTVVQFLYPSKAEDGEHSDSKLIGFQTVEAVLIEEEAQSAITLLKILGSLPNKPNCDPEIAERAEIIFSELYPEIFSTLLKQSLQLDPSRALSPASLRISDARIKVIVAMLQTFEESRSNYLSSELEMNWSMMTCAPLAKSPNCASQHTSASGESRE